MTVFETQRLIVRAWMQSDSDLDRLFDTYSRWEVARWLGADPKAMTSRDQAVRTIHRWSELASAPFGIWAVEVRDTGVVAGTVLLVELPEPTDGQHAGAVEVGWHLHPDSWHRGYATESARGALDRGFAHGLAEVYAVVRPGNDASMAVCRRLGMHPLGPTDRWYGTELEAFRATVTRRT